MQKFIGIILIAIGATSCSKPDVAPPLPIKTIEVAPRQIYYDKTTAFSLVSGPNPVDPANYTWQSSNTHVGVIDSKGVFTAKHVGLTDITAQTKDKEIVFEGQVFVKPYNSLYREPLIKYNATSNDILLYETRSKYASDSESLIFKGEHLRIDFVMYALKDDKNTSTAIIIPNTIEKTKDITQFLTERYMLTGYLNNIYRFTNNTTVDVGLTTDPKLGIVVLYIPRKIGGRIGLTEFVNYANGLLIKHGIHRAVE